jgi:hypothetical protein
MIRPRTITASNTSQEVLKLIRSTALANMVREVSAPTEEEVKKYKIPTEELLLLFAALDIAITDVASEFADAGLYRHAVKRELNAIEQIVMTTYKALYAKLQVVEKEITRKSYDYWMVRVSDAIDDNILLTPPKRSYNIAVALARLIVKCNDSLGRFIVAEAHPIRHVVTRLERINVVEDHHIDFIIERTIKDLRK